MTGAIILMFMCLFLINESQRNNHANQEIIEKNTFNKVTHDHEQVTLTIKNHKDNNVIRQKSYHRNANRT